MRQTSRAIRSAAGRWRTDLWGVRHCYAPMTCAEKNRTSTIPENDKEDAWFIAH